MRIVLDLQGAQASNRLRGIGRYSLSLAQAIVRNRQHHEILIALNGHFPDSIDSIRDAFNGLLPQDNIRVWTVPNLTSVASQDKRRFQAAELLRESFLASLKPDAVLVSSLFEGNDGSVTSIGSLKISALTAVILYDLIPYINQDAYLRDVRQKQFYFQKLYHLRRADLCLAISEATRQDAVDYLGFPDQSVVNILGDADPRFRKLNVPAERERALRARYRLERPFVMYTGGLDARKNIDGLIRAYALLPVELRQQHKLAIVCKITQDARIKLDQFGLECGLSSGELVLTDFVPDDDLIALYNICKLFVFPSRYEGFGLPLLEAMRCGAPVIGADTSSIPEVIGLPHALFAPEQESALTKKLSQGLSDETFRKELIQHGMGQASRFSWDDTAKRALSAIESSFAVSAAKPKSLAVPQARRPKMAFFSPLPPEQSGIADYSAELLPELARHYDIDVIASESEVSDAWVRACLPIRDAEWFLKNASRYERILYHFGNSHFHGHMFSLLDRFPGVVVLHDFFLSGVQEYLAVHGLRPDGWRQELYIAHGYSALADTGSKAFKYPGSFSVTSQAIGVIVHSKYAKQLAESWYGEDFSKRWIIVPGLRARRRSIDREEARRVLGVSEDEFLICSFGMLGLTKQNHRLLSAWRNSNLAEKNRSRLVFVGGVHDAQYGRLLEALAGDDLKDRVTITGWTTGEVFRQYLAAADIAVQLRTLSRGETSAAVLDCMNFALPTIVNANGAMAEIPRDAVYMLADAFEDSKLCNALETLAADPAMRAALGSRAQQVVSTHHAPRVCADQYAQAIEAFYARAATGQQALVKSLAQLDDPPASEKELVDLATALAKNQPAPRPARRLFVDISELVRRDSRTGIQRVVRALLRELLLHPPAGYRTEPVYARDSELGYRHARQFTHAFLECGPPVLEDDFIEPCAEDLFLGLDLQHDVVVARKQYFSDLRRWGIRVYFMVYDLLPVLMPQHFLKCLEPLHSNWLKTVLEANGAICISQAVANDLREWSRENCPRECRRSNIRHFHLGADIDTSSPSRGLPHGAEDMLKRFGAHPTFLMVGTVEPRKGHAQTLEAFERLWAKGVDSNLVVVGKQGWMVDALADRLHNHPQNGRRLFWLQNVSDEFLEKIYAAASCLIAASEGEGFGLPLTEAARNGLPIIAREIPVFREVAGEYAFYFRGKDATALAEAVKKWLVLRSTGEHPRPGGMRCLTWKQSAELLKAILTEEDKSDHQQDAADQLGARSFVEPAERVERRDISFA